MNLSEPFINRPIMTVLLTLTLVFAGIAAYFRLPVSNLPNVDYPTINVEVSYPGASPEVMANNVATPLEKEFLTIPGVTSVTSSNTLSNTNIVLQFQVDKDIDSAAQDVQAAVTRAKTRLPPDLPNDPTYEKVNPSQTPILYIALTSEVMPLSEMYTYANIIIGQSLSTIEGVAQVITYGSPYAVRVQMNPDSLANVGLTLEDISEAVQRGNPYLPTGQLDGENRSSIIIVDGQLKNADAYQKLIVDYQNNAPVRIEDLGKAINSLQNDRYNLEYIDEGTRKPAVVLAVQRQPGANTVEVANQIRQYLPILEKQLPPTLQLKILFDRSQTIIDSVEEVELTLVVAFLLIVIVIFFYLGNFRNTLIPILIIPTSIAGTLIFMDYLGYSIDNLSLLALILAIGFIIDDAIVVLENIVRKVEEGDTPYKAALKGSQQIGFTIVSMSLSLIAVFIPMLFLGGVLGKIFREFAITLTIITAISGIISLTLTPMVSSLFVPANIKEEKKGIFAKISDWINEKSLALYAPLLRWVLRHRYIPIIIAVLSLIGSLYFFAVLPKDFIPDDDIGFVIGYTQAEQATSSERMKEYQSQIVDVIRSNPAVASITSISSFSQYRQGILFIRLVPLNERKKSSTEIITEFYKNTRKIPGIEAFFKNIPLIDLSQGAQTRGAYQFILRSLDADALYGVADEFITKMKQLPFFQGVNSDLEINNPQINVEILRDEASSLGINAFQIERAFQLAFGGGRVSRILTPLDQYDVIVELEKEFQENPSVFPKIYLRPETGENLVPLNAVANWSEGVGFASINHYAQFPAVTISFGLKQGYALGDALEALDRLAQEILPSDVRGSVLGAAQTFQESIQGTTFLLIIAVLAIYVILGILYESFIHPITILSTLPPATFGGLLTLYLFDLPLSMYSYLGIILLIGIVKKNGILMVDYALENIRFKGQEDEKAIYEASLVRFRPIMMTTMTTIFGVLPIALAIGASAEARQPLGLVIIGGMVFSQLLTLLITPVIFLYLQKLNDKFSLRKAE